MIGGLLELNKEFRCLFWQRFPGRPHGFGSGFVRGRKSVSKVRRSLRCPSVFTFPSLPAKHSSHPQDRRSIGRHRDKPCNLARASHHRGNGHACVCALVHRCFVLVHVDAQCSSSSPPPNAFPLRLLARCPPRILSPAACGVPAAVFLRACAGFLCGCATDALCLEHREAVSLSQR